MNKYITRLVIAGFVFVGIVVLLTSYFSEEREKDIVAQFSIEILDQQKTLLGIAEITSRDGMDEIGESIVVDCRSSDRARFDSLLNRLEELSYTELEETENLFDKCASFYAQRKAMMVARMKREYEAYEGLIMLLAIIDDEITVVSYDLTNWQHLVDIEKRREELYHEQVTIQKDIIISLKEGEKIYSDKLKNLLLKAKNVSDELIVNDKQARVLRTSLADI